MKRSNPDELSIVEVDYSSRESLAKAVFGAFAVLSCLWGLEEAMIHVQQRLLEAAIAAKITRFVPSDYSVDFTRFPSGYNRNFDLRRKFHGVAKDVIENASKGKEPIIQFTSVFCGCFMEIVQSGKFLVRFSDKEIAYYGDQDTGMDFTSIEDVAKYTAAVALDKSRTPLKLHIAGAQVSPVQLQTIASKATKEEFGIRWLMPFWLLWIVSWFLRIFFPGDKDDVAPLWQNIQYAYCYKFVQPEPELDNRRYKNISWISMEDILREGYQAFVEEARQLDKTKDKASKKTNKKVKGT
ncbi:hypothetical protein BC830DRAFT_30838 [Chytriomyces sp. MP71]|nr:hypothetical protein BC830DRAFT_30838 [Chytriomyces sp. MP71]